LNYFSFKDENGRFFAGRFLLHPHEYAATQGCSYVVSLSRGILAVLEDLCNL